MATVNELHKCANCGKEFDFSSLLPMMSANREYYACSDRCMASFYKPQKRDVLSFEFTETKKELPPIEEPVLIKGEYGTVQHIVYVLEASEDLTRYWFEPYHFDSDDDLKLGIDKVLSWALMPN
jgi:DNA-directed RNA polymerase subunit RPC12/RpoP